MNINYLAKTDSCSSCATFLCRKWSDAIHKSVQVIYNLFNNLK